MYMYFLYAFCNHECGVVLGLIHACIILATKMERLERELVLILLIQWHFEMNCWENKTLLAGTKRIIAVAFKSVWLVRGYNVTRTFWKLSYR